MTDIPAKQFIELLTGKPDSPVHWQVYHDSDKSDAGVDLACNFYHTYDQAAKFLEKSQQSGCGVYITINETDGSGRRENNITQCRACFIDIDNQLLPSRWMVEPSAVVQRNPNYAHVYWLIEPTDDFEKWQHTQYQLAVYYGVKDRLFDLPRVMRAPGFKHLKNPQSPEKYELIWTGGDSLNDLPRYSLSELIGTLPLSQQQQQEYESWASAPKLKKNSSAVAVEDDTPENIDRFKTRLSRVNPETGDYNNTLFRAAATGKDLGLSERVVIENITQWWPTAFTIPVEPRSIKKITSNAYRYTVNAQGSETTARKFANAPPVTEQVR